MPYCPRDGTALSSHEVALGYHDVEDPSVYVKLPVQQPAPSDAIPESPLEPGDQLLVWTTTPWTLITQRGGRRRRRRSSTCGRASEARSSSSRGTASSTSSARTPRCSPTSPARRSPGPPTSPPSTTSPTTARAATPSCSRDFVTTDEGTGLVHTAIAFGEDDFRLGEQYGIKLQNPVDDRGRFDERITDFAGRFVKEADQDIIKALEERGKLLRAETYLHAYPHCWRCDTPLLYYAKSSWYVKTTEVRDRLLAANEEIGWHPEHIKHGRFGKWLEGNVDWALSRDRYWGTPLPIWECDAADCDERFCAGSIADLRERAGEVPDDLHRPYIDEVNWGCEREGCDGTMRRVPSVIDAWFDSGSMPWAQFHYPFENEELFEERFPADFICEAIDQTRGWFYTLLAEAVLLFDTSSYRNVVCLGLILDPEGQKMSKSRGNVVEPWDVIDRHGADAFRWYYFASQQPWAGYRFSRRDGRRGGPPLPAHALEHLRLLGDLRERLRPRDRRAALPCPGGPRGSEPEVTELDRWAVSRLQRTIAEVREQMEGFDCTTAARAIADYTDELSNWYVRLNRRRFWDGDLAALETLRFCLGETAKLLAPFTPFIAEEIYANLLFGRGDRARQARRSVDQSRSPTRSTSATTRRSTRG